MIAYGVPSKYKNSDKIDRWTVFIPTGIDYRVFGAVRGRIDKSVFEMDPYEAIRHILRFPQNMRFAVLMADLSTGEISLMEAKS